MNDFLILLLGIICAGVGGELFVRGLVGLACRLRVSPGIIGATVAAFATSSPELAVAINSSIAETPQVALGNALGANVTNVALILGISLLISAVHTPRGSVKRDFPVAVIVPVITGAMALDGVISRLDGIVLLGVFIVWMVASAIEAKNQRSAAAEVLGDHCSSLKAIIWSVIGLAFLAVSGRFFVQGGTGIADALGLDPLIVGATFVAIGTTLPELATTVISKIRGHEEVGIGVVLGSNIFNGLFIVSIASIICPITVNLRETAVILLFGLLSVAFIYPSNRGIIERRRAPLMLILYIVYMITIFQG